MCRKTLNGFAPKNQNNLYSSLVCVCCVGGGVELLAAEHAINNEEELLEMTN